MQGYNIFSYCANNPVSRIDSSGADSTKIEGGDILDDELYCYGASSGTGSMIGNISYISSKDTGSWNCTFSLWEWLASKLFKKKSATSNIESISTVTSTPNATEIIHTTGTSSPKIMSNPNGSYTQIGSNGKIYSYVQYNSKGNQTLRIDFQGKPHDGVLPHIHLYKYLDRGGCKEYTFDLNWHLLRE